tara:strand:- start:1329 stop:1451 length:123 start_codon:yes stop_codon:yes gene_type:complete
MSDNSTGERGSHWADLWRFIETLWRIYGGEDANAFFFGGQ